MSVSLADSRLGEGGVVTVTSRRELVKAINVGDYKTFKAMLPLVHNLNVRDDIGWTPLFYAVAAGDLRMIFALMKRGAKADIRDNAGWTPAAHAKLDGHDAARLVLEQQTLWNRVSCA
jgi:ankyrin repeat protein